MSSGVFAVTFTPFDSQGVDQLAHQGLQIGAILVPSVLFYVLARILLCGEMFPHLQFGYPVEQLTWKADYKCFPFNHFQITTCFPSILQR